MNNEQKKDVLKSINPKNIKDIDTKLISFLTLVDGKIIIVDNKIPYENNNLNESFKITNFYFQLINWKKQIDNLLETNKKSILDTPTNKFNYSSNKRDIVKVSDSFTEEKQINFQQNNNNNIYLDNNNLLNSKKTFLKDEIKEPESARSKFNKEDFSNEENQPKNLNRFNIKNLKTYGNFSSYSEQKTVTRNSNFPKSISQRIDEKLKLKKEEALKKKLNNPINNIENINESTNLNNQPNTRSISLYKPSNIKNKILNDYENYKNENKEKLVSIKQSLENNQRYNHNKDLEEKMNSYRLINPSSTFNKNEQYIESSIDIQNQYNSLLSKIHSRKDNFLEYNKANLKRKETPNRYYSLYKSENKSIVTSPKTGDSLAEFLHKKSNPNELRRNSIMVRGSQYSTKWTYDNNLMNNQNSSKNSLIKPINILKNIPKTFL